MKTTLAVMVIMMFLVSGASFVLAQSVPVPSNREPAEAAPEPGQERGAGAEVKVAELQQAKKTAGYKKAPAANKKGMRTSKADEAAQSAKLTQPNYSVSPGVKRDRRLAIDAAYLKHYAEPNRVIGEAFWVTERDGALMMVDPQTSQGLR